MSPTTTTAANVRKSDFIVFPDGHAQVFALTTNADGTITANVYDDGMTYRFALGAPDATVTIIRPSAF